MVGSSSGSACPSRGSIAGRTKPGCCLMVGREPIAAPGLPGTCGEHTIAVNVHGTLGVGGSWRPANLLWGDLSYSSMMLEQGVRMKTEAR